MPSVVPKAPFPPKKKASRGRKPPMPPMPMKKMPAPMPMPMEDRGPMAPPFQRLSSAGRRAPA